MSDDLAVRLAQRMAQLGLSYRQAAARSGGQVSHGTLNAIVTGRHSGQLTARTARGIACALDLPIEQVVRPAPATHPERFVLPQRIQGRWALLTPRQQRSVRRATYALVDAFLELEQPA